MVKEGSLLGKFFSSFYHTISINVQKNLLNLSLPLAQDSMQELPQVDLRVSSNCGSLQSPNNRYF